MLSRLPSFATRRVLVLFFSLLLAPAGLLGADAAPVRVLFLGNSFLFGSGSPVRFFRPGTVNDLNRAGVGGVPALFKSFTGDAGLAYEVSVETASGQGFDFHLEKKASLIGRPRDRVSISIWRRRPR